jgi:transposase
MLIPTVRRTWAPTGQTPSVRHRYKRARISVIGGLAISPRRRRLSLCFRLHPKNISHQEVYDFLWYLLRHLRGHVIVIWDGASIHTPSPNSDLAVLCARFSRLHLERLPAYAPQLNPIEAAWHCAKHPLANGAPDNIEERGDRLLSNLHKLRHSQRHLRGCISQSELPPFCHEYCITYATVNNERFRNTYRLELCPSSA